MRMTRLNGTSWATRCSERESARSLRVVVYLPPCPFVFAASFFYISKIGFHPARAYPAQCQVEFVGTPAYFDFECGSIHLGRISLTATYQLN
jgi:hypothetical protein